LGKQITSLPEETMKACRNTRGPANVRELQSVLEWDLILCPGSVLQLADKPEISSFPLSPSMRSSEETGKTKFLKCLLKPAELRERRGRSDLAPAPEYLKSEDS